MSRACRLKTSISNNCSLTHDYNKNSMIQFFQKYSKRHLMLTLCPNCSSTCFVFEIAPDKVLKVQWNIFQQFQQCSEVFEKSSEMFKTHWEVFWKFLPWQNENLTHLTQKKLPGIDPTTGDTKCLVPSLGRCGRELSPHPSRYWPLGFQTLLSFVHFLVKMLVQPCSIRCYQNFTAIIPLSFI